MVVLAILIALIIAHIFGLYCAKYFWDLRMYCMIAYISSFLLAADIFWIFKLVETFVFA